MAKPVKKHAKEDDVRKTPKKQKILQESIEAKQFVIEKQSDDSSDSDSSDSESKKQQIPQESIEVNHCPKERQSNDCSDLDSNDSDGVSSSSEGETDLNESSDSTDSSDDEKLLPKRGKIMVKPEESESAKLKLEREKRIEQAKRTIFIKNIPWGSDEASIQEFLKEAGEILEIRLPRNAEGRLRGYAHVEFASKEAAKKAYAMSGERFGRWPIFIDFAKEWKYRPPPNHGQESAQGEKKGSRRGTKSEENRAKKCGSRRNIKSEKNRAKKCGSRRGTIFDENRANKCSTLVGTGTKIIFPEDDD